VFGPILVRADGGLLGAPGTDLETQFVHWRAFGFGHLCRGELPLWNPHVFGGAPYLASFQSALLYPPNGLFCLLPLDRALDVSVVLHVLIAGMATAFWLWSRALAPLACAVGGVVLMLGGGFFLHVYPGHVANLCTMAWAPLVFAAIDGLAREGLARRWLGLGVLAVALQILAGHPQRVYHTALAVALYVLLYPTSARRRTLVGGTAVMYGAAALVAAVQLFPGIVAAGTSVRTGPVPFAFAAQLPFPPENLLTLVAWDVLGPVDRYVGRGLLWESSLYVGAAGVTLAAIGWLRLDRGWRRATAALLGILLVLALGSRTPLFAALYRIVPGFGAFRAATKFGLQMTIVLALLVAEGVDAVVRRARWWRTGAVVLACAIGVLGAAGLVRSAPAWVAAYQRSVAVASEHVAYPADHLPEPSGAAAATAAGALARAGGVLIVCGLAFATSGRVPAARYAVPIVAMLELLVFARQNVPVSPLAGAYPARVQTLPRQLRGHDLRVLDADSPDLGMSGDYFDLWGQDPGVPRRYAEFMWFAFGANPDRATQYLPPPSVPPRLVELLRGRYEVGAGGELHELTRRSPLPRVELVHEAIVGHGRDAIFRTLVAPGFDPARSVVLEEEPTPAPQPATAEERAEVLHEETDALDLDVTLSAPGIVVVTDGYDEGWHAYLRDGGAVVPVMPADYVLRGLVLPAGRHRIALEYRPRSFVVGAWVSAIAMLVVTGGAGIGWTARGHARLVNAPRR
jgi:hypothetical protein